MNKQIDEIAKNNRKKGIHKVYAFLDFDGVINVFYAPGMPGYEEKAKEPADDFHFANAQCIQRLNALCEEYPIYVVISSTWRFAGLQQCAEYLMKEGFQHPDQLVDITTLEGCDTREEEIRLYLQQHPDYSQYIIFDDMHMQGLQEHLVCTNPFAGWDEKSDLCARSILKNL